MRLALLLLLLLPTRAWAEEPVDRQLDGARATLGAYARLVNGRKLDELERVLTNRVDYRSESRVHVQGSAAVAKALREACDAKPDFRIAIEAGAARRISPTVALVDGRWRTWDATDATPQEGGLTATCVREGNVWRIAALREWVDELTPREALFQDLAWLQGSWEGKSQGVAFRIDAALTPGGGFLHLAMQFGGSAEDAIGLSTLFGLDASTRSVRSWHFLHDGAHGQGTWTVRARKLEGKVRFVSAGGEVVHSVRRITLRDDGSLVFETKERRIGDKVLPALKPVQLKRVVNKEDTRPKGR